MEETLLCSGSSGTSCIPPSQGMLILNQPMSQRATPDMPCTQSTEVAVEIPLHGTEVQVVEANADEPSHRLPVDRFSFRIATPTAVPMSATNVSQPLSPVTTRANTLAASMAESMQDTTPPQSDGFACIIACDSEKERSEWLASIAQAIVCQVVCACCVFSLELPTDCCFWSILLIGTFATSTTTNYYYCVQTSGGIFVQYALDTIHNYSSLRSDYTTYCCLGCCCCCCF
jgi:hypothetical protein